MKRLITVVLTTAALALGGAALAQQPPSLMNRLDKYCVATKGSSDAARRAARADGFVTPPMELIPDLPQDVDDLEVFWDVFDGGVVMLLTGTVNDPSIGMKGDFCAVATMPPNAQAARDLESWIGAKLPKDGYLMFADEPGGKKMIKQDDARALLLAVRDDRLRMAGAKTEDNMTLLMLLALRL